MPVEARCLKLTALGLAGAVLAGVAACSKQEPARPPEAAQLERGEYLVNITGCHDCHSPKTFGPAGPELDKTRILSGYRAADPVPPVPSGVIGPGQWGALANNELTAWAGPWGVSFAINLTPDASGLGSWTPENFIQAMRTGKHMGNGRAILPPMPWQDIGKMTDDDLRAVFAYLKSLPPVANQVPAPLPPAAPAPGMAAPGATPGQPGAPGTLPPSGPPAPGMAPPPGTGPAPGAPAPAGPAAPSTPPPPPTPGSLTPGPTAPISPPPVAPPPGSSGR